MGMGVNWGKNSPVSGWISLLVWYCTLKVYKTFHCKVCRYEVAGMVQDILLVGVEGSLMEEGCLVSFGIVGGVW